MVLAVNNSENKQEKVAYQGDCINNTGYSGNSEVSDEVKLERAKKAVEAFSELPPEWWDFWEIRRDN